MLVDEPLLKQFDAVKISPFWAFSDKTRKDTAYITHGYHRYPAKFIPHIARELIQSYSEPNDLVIDPFCGCGTALIEAKCLGRKSIGVDINPVAHLLTTAKTTAVNPSVLLNHYAELNKSIDGYCDDTDKTREVHPRIEYWFDDQRKQKLAFLLEHIKAIPEETSQNFFLCAFSNILKNCSIWNQGSNKPTRDLEKIPAEPFAAFARHVKSMLKGNKEYYEYLEYSKNTEVFCRPFCGDARIVPIDDGRASLIVTSPPYVTSYEYADLHQLGALWLNFTDDIQAFRKRFIGTASNKSKTFELNSTIADDIVKTMHEKCKKTAAEIATYFGEMNQVFCEMSRVLKSGGHTCFVIGNTSLKGVAIRNAEVFAEQQANLGFKLVDIIMREIPSKMLPSTRDPVNGRFAPSSQSNKKFAYPTEYILIMRKQ